MTEPFQFTRRENDRKVRTADLLQLLRIDRPEQARWLCVGAHDDDIVGGEGLWVIAARQAGIRVDVLITTDGRMGYCTPEERGTIVETRKKEMLACCQIIGVAGDHVHYLDYPDANLYAFRGRRPASAGEPAIHGHVGLQNAMTWYLRKLQPTHLVLPAPTDLHPDHRITYHETMISIYHAQGCIWPELGEPMRGLPIVYESATYSDFNRSPDLELQAGAGLLEQKLKALAAFRSQVQIGLFLDHVRAGGPFEYLCEFAYPFYSPNHYKALFV